MSSGSGHQRKLKGVEKPLFHLEEVPEITEKRDLSTLLPSKWNLLKEIFEREQRVAWREEFYKKQPQQTSKKSFKSESGKRCRTSRVWEKPFWPNKNKNAQYLRHFPNTQWKIQWLFWNEMGWGGGGGRWQGVFLQQVTSQKPLVESKGIFKTRSDLSCQPTK